MSLKSAGTHSKQSRVDQRLFVVKRMKEGGITRRIERESIPRFRSVIMRAAL